MLPYSHRLPAVSVLRSWVASRRHDTPPLPTPPGSTMLLRLTERCRVPVRLDSVAGGVRTGHKVSAVYFLGRCCTAGEAAAGKTGRGQVSEDYDVSGASGAGAGGQLRLQDIETAAPLAEGLDDDSGSSNFSSGGSPVVVDPQEGKNNDNGNNKNNSSSSASGKSCSPAPPRSGLEAGAPRQGVVLDPTADRLVLFHSDRVSTETLEVLGHGQEQYAVLFWMHGAKEEVVGEATGGAVPSPASS